MFVMGEPVLKIRRVQRAALNSGTPGASKPTAAASKPASTQPAVAQSAAPQPAVAALGTAGAASPIAIRIRPEQQQVFEQAALKKFEDEMIAHSKEFSPELCKVLGDDQLRLAVHAAIQRAGGHGFTFRGPIRLFIEMTFLFGSAFDTDPQYPWAAAILRSTDDQMRRAEKLYDKILDYQEKVSGPDDANTRRSWDNLIGMAQQPLALSPGNFVAGMRQELGRVFPEKAAYVGESGLVKLIQEGSAEARKYRFPTIRGDALVVLLMYGFGHGCIDDALYPWIASTLKDEKIADPASRADRLEKKSVTWLDQVLAKSQAGGLA